MSDNAGDDFDGVADKAKAGIINNPTEAAFGDPSGQYPRSSYHGSSSVNKKALGAETAYLSSGGGHPQTTTSTSTADVPSQYGMVDVKETKSGHVMIFDDTPGGEKVLMMHNSGAGVELRQDGSMMLRSNGNMIASCGANGVWIIEGDMQISANSLSLAVASDFNLTVGGDYNIEVTGDKAETVNGDASYNYNAVLNTTVKGNESKINLASITNVILGSFNKAVKGIFKLSTEGSTTFSSKGKLKASSAESVAMSSPDINIAATSLSVFGDTGTIGGENMQMYTMNLRAGGTVYADVSLDAPKGQISRIDGTSAHYTTFHGSLNGTALRSITADVTNSQNYSDPDTGPGSAGNTGSAAGFTISNQTADDMSNNTAATALPDAEMLTEYLGKSANGVARVNIDPGGYLKNMINKSVDTGNVTTKNLSIGETRRKMRDPAHAANSKFTASAMASGSLSPGYSQETPPSMGRTRSVEPTPKAPTSTIQGANNQAGAKMVQPAEKGPSDRFFADPQYDPMQIDITAGVRAITAATPLGKGITIGTFLGGTGDKATLAHISTITERQQIARQFLMQAEVLKIIKEDKGKFKDYRLVVAEGLYKKSEGEQFTSGEILDLASKGQVVVYEMFSADGKPAPDMLWDYAEYLTDVIHFDKLMLDYDKFDPSGELNAQLIVIMPYVGETYQCAFKNKLETKFNGKVQSTDDLIELLDDPNASDPVKEVEKEREPEPFVSKYDKYKSPIWTYNTQDKYFDDYIDQTGPFANPSADKDGFAKYVFYRANWDGGNIRIHASERATLADQYGPETYGWSPSMTISGFETRYSVKVSQQLKALDNIIRLE